MNTQETWYVMEDGTPGDPHDMVSDKAGMLFHQDGRPVAYGPAGPKSRSMDAEEVQAIRAAKQKANKKPSEPKAEPKAEPKPEPKPEPKAEPKADNNTKKPSGKKDMQAEQNGPGYKTR